MFRRIGILATALLMLTATNVSAATSTVSVNNTAYTPLTRTIVIGNSVKWKNTSGRRHGASPTNNWSWSAITVNAYSTSAVVTPTQTGSYPYFCQFHPTKKGTLNVAMSVNALAGTTATYFGFRLGTVTSPGVLVHQVEARRNGGTWVLRYTGNSATVSLKFTSTGTWDVRSRLRYQLGGGTSGWSPLTTVEVF